MMAATRKLPPKRELVLMALMSMATSKEAAEVAGVSERTLRRWRAEPSFEAAVREARQQAIREAIGRLHGLLNEGIDAIRRNATCGGPSVELRAGVAIIERVFQGAELLDLQDRLSAVEKTVRGEL